MNCKDLNIDLCPWCSLPDAHTYSAPDPRCWINWWRVEFELSDNNVKQYIIATIKTKNLDGWHYIYLSAAIKQFHPELIEWFDKIMVLI
jgi:hypothetical protein